MGLDGAGAHTVEEFKSFIGRAGSGEIVAAKLETPSDRVTSKIGPWVSRLPASLPCVMFRLCVLLLTGRAKHDTT